MKRIILTVICLTLGAAGLVAGVALARVGPPPGQDPCSHGATNKPCKPDPQPDKGKDCEKHGNQGGVNEDHCAGTSPPPPPPDDEPPDDDPPPPPPSDDPPTTTTPTTTTPTTTTPTTTTPEPTATTPAPTATTPQAASPTATTPTTTTPQATTPTTTTPSTTGTTSTSTTQKLLKKPVKLTGNPKKDKCVPKSPSVMICKGVTVVTGNG